MFRDITRLLAAIGLRLQIASWMAAASTRSSAWMRAVWCSARSRGAGGGHDAGAQAAQAPRETLRQDYDLEYGIDSPRLGTARPAGG